MFVHRSVWPAFILSSLASCLVREGKGAKLFTPQLLAAVVGCLPAACLCDADGRRLAALFFPSTSAPLDSSENCLEAAVVVVVLGETIFCLSVF